ncbi:hypothetical protein [Maridesulfovibrio sp.]|uniref:hypothetical protein n=1 Tax=Maridesulfovibrio sp. TaxID=2795000 RepID=UPI002A18C7BF|nr:hypothetical protein [Maridesulfovibrio sp.]
MLPAAGKGETLARVSPFPDPIPFRTFYRAYAPGFGQESVFRIIAIQIVWRGKAIFKGGGFGYF